MSQLSQKSTKQTGFHHKEVSDAVDARYKRHKENIKPKKEERFSDSLVPSNVDANVSADNLKQELLGKSPPKKYTQSKKSVVKDVSQSKVIKESIGK